MKSLLVIVSTCALIVAPIGLAQSVPTAIASGPTTSVGPQATATSTTVDLSQTAVRASNASVSAPANGRPTLDLGKAVGKARKSPVTAGGTWTWTSFNRNGQPFENRLSLTVGKNGKISGKLVDRAGEHEIKDATLGDGVLTFDLKFHTRGEGDLPHTYTVNLDPDNPQISVDRPDFTPLGKSQGGKHHSDHAAKHDPNG